MRLDEVVTKVLVKIEDVEEKVYSRAEIAIYVKDQYNQFCRRTKCLFDMAYVENLPAIGTHSSDEEYEAAKQIPGLLLGHKRTFTGEADRRHAPAGSVGPAGLSNYAYLPYLSQIGMTLPAPTGQLPRGLVEIEQVLHNRVVLRPEFSQGMATQIDNRYESKLGGYTEWFIVDKDGLFTLRRYPSGDGNAQYADVTGYWGVETRDTEYTGTVTGTWGAMVQDTEQFAIGGPWGAPTRLHPEDNNTRIEYTRLGRDLDGHEFEIPNSYIKYIVFGACARALRRDGPGQDLNLAQHYESRFETGVERMVDRVSSKQHDAVGHIGHGPLISNLPPLQISLPYNYGKRRITRSGGRY